MGKKIFYFVIGILIILGFVFVINNIVTGYASGQGRGLLGKISVSSTPTEANIYVDNVFNGITDKVVDASVGYHEVKLTKAGYLNYITNVTVSKKQTTYVNAALETTTTTTSTTSSSSTTIITNQTNQTV